MKKNGRVEVQLHAFLTSALDGLFYVGSSDTNFLVPNVI